MKQLVAIIISLTSLFGLSAQEQGWNTDFETAKKLALEDDRNIILVFQGSDWCAPCMKLDREIWATETFKSYAKENYVLLKADFPKRKQNRLSKEQEEHNNMLAEKYNQNGYFPLVVVLDKNGKVLGQTGYKPISPEEYIKELDTY